MGGQTKEQYVAGKTHYSRPWVEKGYKFVAPVVDSLGNVTASLRLLLDEATTVAKARLGSEVNRRQYVQFWMNIIAFTAFRSYSSGLIKHMEEDFFAQKGLVGPGWRKYAAEFRNHNLLGPGAYNIDAQ